MCGCRVGWYGCPYKIWGFWVKPFLRYTSHSLCDAWTNDGNAGYDIGRTVFGILPQMISVLYEYNMHHWGKLCVKKCVVYLRFCSKLARHKVHETAIFFFTRDSTMNFWTKEFCLTLLHSGQLRVSTFNNCQTTNIPETKTTLALQVDFCQCCCDELNCLLNSNRMIWQLTTQDQPAWATCRNRNRWHVPSRYILWHTNTRRQTMLSVFLTPVLAVRIWGGQW